MATAAFVLAMTASPGQAEIRAPDDSLDDEEKRQALLHAVADPACEWRFTAAIASRLREFPELRSPIGSRTPCCDAFAQGTPLAELFQPRNGMKTGDNGAVPEVMVGGVELADQYSSRLRPRRRIGRQSGGSRTTRVASFGGGTEISIRCRLGGRRPRGSEVIATLDQGNVGAHSRPQILFLPHVPGPTLGTGRRRFDGIPKGCIFDGTGVRYFLRLHRRNEACWILNSRCRGLLACCADAATSRLGMSSAFRPDRLTGLSAVAAVRS